jgi:hypothetical protein
MKTCKSQELLKRFLSPFIYLFIFFFIVYVMILLVHNIMVSRDVTPFSLVGWYQHFRGGCLHCTLKVKATWL